MILPLLGQIAEAIGLALSLSPELLRLAADPGGLNRVAISVAILGGASLLMGESVVLFLNQIPRGRFLLSLLLNGLVFAAELALWALTIWWVGRYGLGVEVALATMVNLVALGAAPFVFGFLVLAPYMGPAIARLLWVWSLLITVQAVAFGLNVGWFLSSVTAGAGWLLVLLLGRTLGRPFVALRNRIWIRVVGRGNPQRARDILELSLDASGGDFLPRGLRRRRRQG